MTPQETSSVVTGILYQHAGSTDTQLLAGIAIAVKLFAGVPITGFAYREDNTPDNKLVSGSRVTGIVWQDGTSTDERVLRTGKVTGVIYQTREHACANDSSASASVDAARDASDSLQILPSGSKIVGIICRDTSTGQEELTTGAKIDMKILSGASVTGIMYEGPEGERIKHLRGSNITGLLFQQPNSSSETVVGDMAVLGLIYKEKPVPGRFGYGSQSPVALAESVVLYMLLIIGVLGLVVPAVRPDASFSALNFLGLPSTVVTTLLAFMVIVPVIILIYRSYTRSRASASSSAPPAFSP